MKTKKKTIVVDIPIFCPDNCTEFELYKQVLRSGRDGRERHIYFSCRHYAFCCQTHTGGGDTLEWI